MSCCRDECSLLDAHQDHEREIGIGQRREVDARSSDCTARHDGHAMREPAMRNGNPREQRCGERRGDSRHDLTSMPFALSTSASSPPRPKTKGSPPFSRTTRSKFRPSSTSNSLMPCWVLERPGTLPTSNRAAVGSMSASTSATDESIVHDHLRAGEESTGAKGQEIRVTRSGADQEDGHDATPSLTRAT